MFVTIEIRGAQQTVRRRNGEEVSDPVLELDEGCEPERPVVLARLDQQRIDRDGYVDTLDRMVDQHMGPLQDLRVVGSAAGTFTGDSSDDAEDQGIPWRERTDHGLGSDGELLRLALERPRRLLRRLHAESARRGRVGVRFLRGLDSGRAIAELSVERGVLVASARLEVARALGGAMGARAQRMKGLAGFELDLEAKLRPDGDLDDVLADVRVRGLDLDTREERMMGRLAGVVRRVVDDGLGVRASRKRLTRILRTWMREHPIWAVALLERLFEDLEHLPITPSVRHIREERRRDLGGPTLGEILAGVKEPGTEELTLDNPPPPSVEWIDDATPRVVVSPARKSALAAAELSRLACVIPVLLEALA